MQFSNFKKFVDRIPWLAKLFRDIRDRHNMKQIKEEQTPYGFKFLGGNFLVAGIQEPLEIQLVTSEIKQADVVVDVGANSGMWTCVGAQMGKHVVAVEPVPANLRILFHNILANGFSGNVEVFPLAVSKEVGVLPMYGRGQGASLVRGWGKQSEYDYFSVPVNTLDRLIGDRFADQQLFLKIDVEGAELAVLEGAEKVLERAKTVMLEISLSRNHVNGFNERFMATFEFLWDRGFEAYTIAEEPLKVDHDLVKQWVSAQKTGLDSENFLFRSKRAPNQV
jgi:FkbM family methyltransferase